MFTLNSHQLKKKEKKMLDLFSLWRQGEIHTIENHGASQKRGIREGRSVSELYVRLSQQGLL